MKNNLVKSAAINGVVAALYFVLTYFFQPIAFSPVLQLRLGEALTVLPFIYGNSYIGLALGCFFANLGSPFGIWDALLGSTVTLIAGYLTSKIKNLYLAPLPPVLLNAFILPVIWKLCGNEIVYVESMLSLLLTQGVTVYAIGIPIVTVIGNYRKKNG